jgi:hypothetical protein
MSERLGIPDHSPQHAPDHSLQNPTAPGNWSNIGSGSDGAWPTAPTYGGGGGGGRWRTRRFKTPCMQLDPITVRAR